MTLSDLILYLLAAVGLLLVTLALLTPSGRLVAARVGERIITALGDLIVKRIGESRVVRKVRGR